MYTLSSHTAAVFLECTSMRAMALVAFGYLLRMAFGVLVYFQFSDMMFCVMDFCIK